MDTNRKLTDVGKTEEFDHVIVNYKNTVKQVPRSKFKDSMIGGTKIIASDDGEGNVTIKLTDSTATDGGDAAIE